jgi:hypothetical protein
MLRPGSHHDSRTQKAVDLLLTDPTQTVPQAMLASGFTVEESRDRAKQMWIRRRIPPKRRKEAGSTQPTTSSTGDTLQISTQLPLQQQVLPAVSAAAFFRKVSESEWSGSDNEDLDGEFECELQDWIFCHSDDIGWLDGDAVDLSQHRKLLEQTVQILYSLACKIVIIGGFNDDNMLEGIGEKKILVHPDFITVANVVVRYSTVSSLFGHENNGQISADFIRVDGSSSFHDEGDEIKYAVMHAFARIAYAMGLRGDGPSLPDFRLRNCVTLSTALSLQDDAVGVADEEAEIMDMIRKQFRAAESEDINGNEFVSAMLDAGIPLPMRRFISDLLGNQDGNMFRPERAFTSFEDVISDLKQMTIHPDRFLHGTHSDRWKIVFDDKLYGREADMEVLMVVADRVTRTIDKGALHHRHNRLAGKKSEIVMVSGHSGAGKSRLVCMGGASLENRGWLFLRCKFDRVGELNSLIYIIPQRVNTHNGCELYFMAFTLGSLRLMII